LNICVRSNPLPAQPSKRREVQGASSVTKWIVIYTVAILCSFGISFLYFSSPSFFSWKGSVDTAKQATSPQHPPQNTTPSQRVENSSVILKNSFNQFSVLIQKSSILIDDSKKVNIPGDSKGTALNYRSVQRGAEALLAQLIIPPDALPEVGAVVMPLKESMSLLSKASAIMADYLDGKLSLAPPNPDWVARSQEYSAQSQTRLKEAQEALSNLRKIIK